MVTLFALVGHRVPGVVSYSIRVLARLGRANRDGLDLARHPGDGFEREEVLVRNRAVTERFPVALYTGRNPGEAALALVRCELHVPQRLCWVSDGRPRKPDPAGLVWLCHELLKGAQRGSQVLFIGDTADDQAASRAAQEHGAPIVYAHVQGPGDTTRVLSRLLMETSSGATA